MKFSRQCPQCGMIIGYSRKDSLARANENNSLCVKCAWDKRRIQNKVLAQREYSRECPKCKVIIKYKLRDSFTRAEKINSLCNKCKKKGVKHIIKPKKEYTKECPVCGKTLKYKKQWYLTKACRKNNVCRTCSQKGIKKTNTGQFSEGHKTNVGRIVNATTRRKISKSNGIKKGNITKLHDRVRHSFEYKKWRVSVFTRDDYTCKICKSRGSVLNAHHMKEFSKLLSEAKGVLPLYSDYDACMAYRPFWDTNNGITLCKECHKKVHSKKLSKVDRERLREELLTIIANSEKEGNNDNR